MTEEQLTPTVAAELRDEAQGQLDAAIALRRTLHRWPEVGNELPRTRDEVLDALDGTAPRRHRARVDERHHGAAHREPSPARRSCSAATWTPSRCTRTPASSSRPASTHQMHACGHDTHTAMLVGAARLLATAPASSPAGCCSCSSPARRATTAPASCSTRGCSTCPPLANGTPSPVSRGVRPAHHVVAAERVAHVPGRAGDGVGRHACHIDIIGKGGHASEPFRAGDPIPVACEIVQALQTMVTRTDRRVRPVGGHRRPHHGRHDRQHHPRDGAASSARSAAVSESTRTRVHDNIRRVAEDVAAAHGLEAHGRDRGRLPGHDQRRRRSPRRRSPWPPGHRRRRAGGAAPPPDHGRRGLQLRAAAGAGLDDVPRRHPARPPTRPRPRRTTPTG